MNPFLICGLLILNFATVQAQEIPLLNGAHPEQRITARQFASQVKPGQIVVLGENHGLKSAQQGQLEVLNALRGAGLKVSVGLEFFYYPYQPQVTAYREGKLSEPEFLKAINWSMMSFDQYRAQAVFPRLDQGESTLAINALRSLAAKVSKQGFESLTPEERALVPPDFQPGSAAYKRRFMNGGNPHLPPDPLGRERSFLAQSLNDDTMAWKAAEFIKAHPDQVLAIVVGDFHVQYGGGLPDRILARTHAKPWVFSFVNTAGLSPEEVQQEVQPSKLDGPRGDLIWLANEEM